MLSLTLSYVQYVLINLYFHVHITDYIGLLMTNLKGKTIVLFDDKGHALCDRLVCNTNLMDCVDNRILEAEDVGVII